MTLVERLRERARELYGKTRYENDFDKAADRIEALEAELAKAREALEPFAKVGKLLDGPFGPALFNNDDDAFQSGCAWTEDGEKKTLTWGQFRRASDVFQALKDKGADG